MGIINRDISWLSFNARVLQEAQNDKNPLIERFRFLGIYSNNLDEFFRVRVANLKRTIQAQNTKKVSGFKGTPAQLFEVIRTIVVEQQNKFNETYQKLILLLKEKGISYYDEKNLSEEQKLELKKYFSEKIVHDIVPILLTNRQPFPRLRDKAIYLGVKMSQRNKNLYAIIEIPSSLSRFYQFKDQNEKGFILIDDIIRLHLQEIFWTFNFDQIQAYTLKFTRDAGIDLDSDVSTSFEEKMMKGVKDRKKGDPVRLVYDTEMPEDLLEMIARKLNLALGVNTIPGGRYHNFKDFMKFPDFDLVDELNTPFKAKKHPDLAESKSAIKIINKKNILLHFPYQRFDYIVDLIREAAIDPDVYSIKINLYRVAQNSQVMNALINAIRNGKLVTAVMEIQARFDEENNYYWAQRIKEEGGYVHYGYAGEKIHSKLLLIQRESKSKKLRSIAYIGTGNFNESTSKIYTDLAYLTSDPLITKEVNMVFDRIVNPLTPVKFKNLLVSPINNREKLHEFILNEAKNAQAGLPSGIDIKVNNLVDNRLIEALQFAARKGVRIRLIVRGICCLIPLPKSTENNIEIISVVGKYLEHSRFCIFKNAGNPITIITSADWMERNLNRRIEVGVQIEDPEIKTELQNLFNLYLKDTVKSRIINRKQNNSLKKGAAFNIQDYLQNEYYNSESN